MAWCGVIYENSAPAASQVTCITKPGGTIIPLTIVPWTVYLAIPISISPLLILLPCAVLLGVSVYITVSSFKKYL